MPGVSRRSSLGGGPHRRIPWAEVVAAAVAAGSMVILGGTLCVLLLLAACDSRVTTVGETCMETSYQ